MITIPICKISVQVGDVVMINNLPASSPYGHRRVDGGDKYIGCKGTIKRVCNNDTIPEGNYYGYVVFKYRNRTNEMAYFFDDLTVIERKGKKYNGKIVSSKRSKKD
jgi:hypothetical protein